MVARDRKRFETEYLFRNKPEYGVSLTPLGRSWGERVCDPAVPYGSHTEAVGTPLIVLICFFPTSVLVIDELFTTV